MTILKQETFNRLSVILFALVFIAGFVALAFYGDIANKEEPRDKYFICSVEKLADDYYSMVYTRNGKSYYPHFTHERQVFTFLDYLETIGDVDRNGYEVNK
jgi:hypothetical protein